ncbi:MAG: hypothetical protein IJY11_03825 [Clostridia bacterium]|nr:hypothetical protein [Clostridia bacterium]
MRDTIKHDVYGYITYDESFWSGKCTVQFDGQYLEKTGKKTFVKQTEDGVINVAVKGNFITGVKLVINGEELQVVPAIKWYEVVLSAAIFVLILVWGNNVALCSVVPVVGGAIGGFISALFAVLNVIIVKRIKNVWLKILVSLGMMGLTFLLCYLGALVFLSSVA